MIDGGATLARRLDRYRSAIRAQGRDGAAPPTDDLAGRLATAVGGEIVRTSEGVIVRLETPSRALPVEPRTSGLALRQVSAVAASVLRQRAAAGTDQRSGSARA